MKIIYSADSHMGSWIQMNRIVKDLKDRGHEVIRCCGYYHPSEGELEWCWDGFDSLHELYKGLKGTSQRAVIKKITEETEGLGIDLILSDNESIMSNIGTTLGIEVWQCSYSYSQVGINRFLKGNSRYRAINDLNRRTICRLPASRKLIYSFLGDLDYSNSIKIKNGYEWVRPYCYMKKSNGDNNMAILNDDRRRDKLEALFRGQNEKIKIFGKRKDEDEYIKFLKESSWYFCLGATSYLADAIYSGIKRIVVSPRLDDMESLMNAKYISKLKIGHDLGQIEKMGSYGLIEFEKTFKYNNRMFIGAEDIKLKDKLNPLLGDLM